MLFKAKLYGRVEVKDARGISVHTKTLSLFLYPICTSQYEIDNPRPVC